MNASLHQNQHLPAANACTAAIDEAWTGTNEQWWNWYISLAHDSEQPATPPTLIDRPQSVPPRWPTREELHQELAQPYALSEHQIQQFRTDSFVKLKQVFSPAALALLRQELKALFEKHTPSDPARRFSSRELLWLENDIAREFVLSPRLGRLAAELLGVASVRVYHDDFLCKEPGCGRTPWHYDSHHYPIDSPHVGTMWIPLQPTPPDMGPLELAKGMDVHRIIQAVPFDKFSNSHDRRVAETLQERGIVIDRGPFDIGEISFQHGLNVHGAGANQTTQQRIAFGISYFENGACVVAAPGLISGDWQKFMPGVQPCEPIVSPYNPVVHG